MAAWSTNEWAIVVLAFLAGLLVGFAFLGGRKWKRRYQDEMVRRQTYQEENEKLRQLDREKDSLRAAAARSPGNPDI